MEEGEERTKKILPAYSKIFTPKSLTRLRVKGVDEKVKRSLTGIILAIICNHIGGLW